MSPEDFSKLFKDDAMPNTLCGLKKDYIQIVGHTQMQKIDLIGSDKFTGGRYYFIDTMDTSGDYLVIQDNNLIVNSVK